VALDRLPACTRFTELAKLVEPGQEPKTDKLSVLQEAIRCVQQMQVENSQLKQLNKFMEVGAFPPPMSVECVTFHNTGIASISPCTCWSIL
jgi:hypothetical protein